jgi:hypothetical protein
MSNSQQFGNTHSGLRIKESFVGLRFVYLIVIGNSVGDSADTKRQDIEQTFKTTNNNMTALLTNRHTLQKN